MDIAAAETALAREIAQLGRLDFGRTVRCGVSVLTEAAPLVLVRFVSGKLAEEKLTEFVAEVRGVFAEPDEAQAFAVAVWGALPLYGTAGFAEIGAADFVEFAEKDGFFIAAGRIRACFA
jgi:hypothetical protein